MNKVKNKENFFYSKEEDEVIVDAVRTDFLSRQAERKAVERTWELNLNFYVGNHYSYISSIGDLSDIEKNYLWESREVYNHIAPIIECRLAKLAKVKPALSVRAASSLDEDLKRADIAKAVLKSAINKNNFDKLVMEATAWSEIVGTAFYKITWDSGIGDAIGEVSGTKLASGDAIVSVCSPFEIYPSSNACKDINDCESIIQAKIFSAKEINAIYGTNISGEELDVYEIGTSSFLSTLAGRSNLPKIMHLQKSDSALLIERYEKPSINNPSGRFTVVCKDKLLYDGELPYKDTSGKGFYPFVRQVSTRQVTSFWGSSVIERCIPLQRAYNAIKNKKHEYITRLASGVLSVEDGSVDVENLENEGLAPGKILVYRNGSTPPEFLKPSSVPVELEKEEANLISEMNNLCCVSDISINSSLPNNLSSGSALSILIEQDESRLSLVAENIRIAMKNVGELVLKLYKQFASGRRISKVANLKNSCDVISWTNSELGYDDVVLETINEFEESTIKQKEMILSLYEKGLFSNSKGEVSSSTKRKIFDSLGIKDYLIDEDISEIQRQQAKFENQDIKNVSDPLEIDDHSEHILEHMKYLYFSNEIKTDKVIKEKLIKHIKKHQEMQNIGE